MKLRVLFLSFLFPFMALSQYYVGRLANYDYTSFQYSRLDNIKAAMNADGSMYLYYKNKMIKITPNGTLDSSFGVNGTIGIGAFSTFTSDIIANNQAIYLLLDNKIAKYDLMGAPDLSFGLNGIVTFSQSISKIFVNPDSSLYFSSNNQIKKMFPNGVVDSSFTINVPANKFYFINNNFYIFNKSHVGMTVTKHSLNGIKDLTYGNVGSLAVASYYSHIDTASGNIYTTEPTQIKRYTSSGVPDITFGIGGTVLGNFPWDIHSVNIDSNNNILFFGGIQPYAYSRAVIFRLKNNGEPDNSFNNGSNQYFGDSGKIFIASLVDDNTYICLDSRRYGLSSYYEGPKKYIRTQDKTLITVDQVLNVNEVKSDKTNNVEVYPNPATEVIHVKVGNNERINKINIYTIAGDFILSGNKAEIDVKHLTIGSYFIEVVTEHKTYKTKFIKK
ncbi:MAG: T9SS type A sorting domain-containing protein [Chryseobacterium jejuense]|uniref:T9SS type A sorting domain-containing protein n=1 Tax=Chryseobacterium jejuense TaxID=445960 RepID=UPI003D109DEE